MKSKNASLADVLLGPERVQKSYWDFDGQPSEFISPKVVDYDIAALPGQMPKPADPVDAADRDSVMASLGRMAALSQPKDDTRTPVWAAAPDAWLDHGKPYIGGRDETRDGGRIMTGRGEEAGEYLFREPDANARGDEGWIETEDGMLARPAAFDVPGPGRVGAVKVTKRAASTVKRGLFTDVVYGG